MICWGEVLSLNCMIGTQSTESKEQRGGIDKFDACPTYSTYTYGTSLISVNLSSIKYHVSWWCVMIFCILYPVLCCVYSTGFPGTRVPGYCTRPGMILILNFVVLERLSFALGCGDVLFIIKYMQNKSVLRSFCCRTWWCVVGYHIYLQSTVPGYRLYVTQKSRAISSKSYILRMTPTTPTLN